MLWRRPSEKREPGRDRSATPAPAVVCRHCGGPRLKLSYRRRDKAANHGEEGADQTTFILRCADCEGFTTVQA